MHIVHFKGGRDSITLDDVKGKALADYLASKPTELFTKIGDTIMQIASIRSVEHMRDPRKEKEYGNLELTELRNKLKNYTPQVIDGKIISRQDQYLMDTGVVSYTDRQFVVRDTRGYRNMVDMFVSLEKYEYGLQKGLEQAAK